jgi:hypothetical protein
LPAHASVASAREAIQHAASGDHEVDAINEASLESRKESFEERVERMKQKTAAFHSAQADKPADELDTKYSRSLSDIKEEYAAWLYQQKKKKKHSFSKKHIVVAASALLVITTGYATVQWIVSEPAPHHQAVLSNQSPDNETNQKSSPVTVSQKQQQQDLEKALKAPADESKYIVTTDIPYETFSFDEGYNNEGYKVSSGSQERVKQEKVKPANPVKKKASVKETQTDSISETGKSVVKGNESANISDKRIPLAQQIDVEGRAIPTGARKGFSRMEVTVQNNSNQMLKLVAVDVYYYNSNDKVLEKKTIYFNNIYPGNSLTKSAPGHKRAVSAKYQMGLVTSEEGSIYFAKQ